MKLARVFCLLIILGSSAIAAHAQTPIDLSSSNGDIHVVLNDPTCVESLCVELMVTGTPTENIDALFFPVTGGTYTPPFLCDTNIATPMQWQCLVETDGGALSGFLFFQPSNDGLTPGTLLDLSSNIPVMLGQSGNTVCVPAGACMGGELDPLATTPEPRSSVLFMTGLLLFSLGGFARKRLGARSHTPKYIG
jgi:hypothetical protein